MTNEEAIDVLKHNYPSTRFTELCEAVETAIKALSAEYADGTQIIRILCPKYDEHDAMDWEA